jgi:hypothetical protein
MIESHVLCSLGFLIVAFSDSNRDTRKLRGPRIFDLYLSIFLLQYA